MQVRPASENILGIAWIFQSLNKTNRNYVFHESSGVGEPNMEDTLAKAVPCLLSTGVR